MYWFLENKRKIIEVIQINRDRILKLLVNIMNKLYIFVYQQFYNFTFILKSMFQRCSTWMYLSVLRFYKSRLVIIREKKREELIDLFDRREIYRDV